MFKCTRSIYEFSRVLFKVEKYRQKIEDCYSKIDRFIESNKNKYDLIYALKECNIKLNEI